MTERTQNADRDAPGGSDGDAGRTITAREARQGRIVLDSRARRAVFLGGLVGLVVVTLALALAAV